MINLQTITTLRQMTGAGMVDCQKALAEVNGDLDQAVEILRKKGEAKAAKKADRVAKEGLIAFKGDTQKVAVIALNCETDFVSRGEDFINAVNEMVEKLYNEGDAGFAAWADAKIKGELIVKIGENIQLNSAEIVTGEVVGTYLHSNKKAAAIVVLKGGTPELASEVGMQAVAMSPAYLNPSDVPADILAKEKEIYLEQLKNEGKPADIAEKIVGGKINKFYEENCLNKQSFIKDDKMSVEKYLESKGATIVSFKRYQI